MAVPVDPKLIDGVEIFNASRIRKGKENAKAIAFARQHNLPVQAGTDAHHPNLKLYSGIMLEKRANDIFDIIRAIKDGTAEPILPPKEKALWKGDLALAEKEAETEEVSEQLVKVFYDCHHARESAEDLCEYIEEHSEFDTVCAHMDELGRIEKSGKEMKTIILGHHSGTKEKLRSMRMIQYQQYGMQYGFNRDLCVLRASKSKLKKSKSEERKFLSAFEERFDFDPEQLYLRKAQFLYLTMEFIQNDLLKFLNE